MSVALPFIFSTDISFVQPLNLPSSASAHSSAFASSRLVAGAAAVL